MEYLIDESTLKSFIKAKFMLQALQDAGVDNWHWYDEASDNFPSIDDINEVLETFKKHDEQRA